MMRGFLYLVVAAALTGAHAPVQAQAQTPGANSRMKRVRVYHIDTRDREACLAFAKSLAEAPESELRPARPLEDRPDLICRENSNEPVKSIVMMDDANEFEIRRELGARILPTEKTLANDTRNLAIGMVGIMGLLWVLPESVSKWDKDSIRNDPDGVLGRWKRNVKAGPVKDKDDPIINYVGHPYAGAATYMLARTNGKSPLESFGYSLAMSTFFWEYGFEALAEVPSIQDLIITPVVGSIVGEAFYNLEREIREGGGTVLGSKGLGKVSLVLLNPAGAFSDWVNRTVDSTVLKNGKLDLIMKRQHNYQGTQTNTVGLQLRFDFYGF